MPTQISDIIETRIYGGLQPDIDLSLLALWNSGIIVAHPEFNRLATDTARSCELIFWRDINMGIEPNLSSTQPVDAVPSHTNQDRMRCFKAFVNQGWSSYNLTYDMTRGTKPMQHIRNRTATYWALYRQARLIAISRGILASNILGRFKAGTTGIAGDMIIDVSTNNSTTATAANRFNSDIFSAAVYTMGDRQGQLGAMVVHSAVMNTMQQNQLIEWVQVAGEPTLVPFYRGRRVVMDDDCPHFLADPANPANGFKYVSIIFGPAAVGYGVGTHHKPVAIEENERTGHGAGSETLWERKQYVTHPFGFDDDNNVATGNEGQKTLSDLQNGTNWTRIVPRKAVPIAFIVTNG